MLFNHICMSPKAKSCETCIHTVRGLAKEFCLPEEKANKLAYDARRNEKKEKRILCVS